MKEGRVRKYMFIEFANIKYKYLFFFNLRNEMIYVSPGL